MNNPTVAPSERYFNPETVCIPCSGVYIARTFNPAIPGTNAEVYKLANAMGAPGGVGANFAKLQTGMYDLYHLQGFHYEGKQSAIDQIHAAIAKSPCIVAIAGDQYNLVPRYQSNHVDHSIMVQYPTKGNPVGIQFDPLAPAGYAGDSFTDTELNAYCTAALIFPFPVSYTQADLDKATADGIAKGTADTTAKWNTWLGTHP